MRKRKDVGVEGGVRACGEGVAGGWSRAGGRWLGTRGTRHCGVWVSEWVQRLGRLRAGGRVKWWEGETGKEAGRAAALSWQPSPFTQPENYSEC